MGKGKKTDKDTLRKVVVTLKSRDIIHSRSLEKYVNVIEANEIRAPKGSGIIMGSTLYKTLLETQKIVSKKVNTTTVKPRLMENGVEISIDGYGYMTAKSPLIGKRLAGKSIAEKLETLDDTLHGIASKLEP